MFLQCSLLVNFRSEYSVWLAIPPRSHRICMVRVSKQSVTTLLSLRPPPSLNAKAPLLCPINISRMCGRQLWQTMPPLRGLTSTLKLKASVASIRQTTCFNMYTKHRRGSRLIETTEKRFGTLWNLFLGAFECCQMLLCQSPAQYVYICTSVSHSVFAQPLPGLSTCQSHIFWHTNLVWCKLRSYVSLHCTELCRQQMV